jgi:hypothetical protein
MIAVKIEQRPSPKVVAARFVQVSLARECADVRQFMSLGCAHLGPFPQEQPAPAPASYYFIILSDIGSSGMMQYMVPLFNGPGRGLGGWLGEGAPGRAAGRWEGSGGVKEQRHLTTNCLHAPRSALALVLTANHRDWPHWANSLSSCNQRQLQACSERFRAPSNSGTTRHVRTYSPPPPPPAGIFGKSQPARNPERTWDFGRPRSLPARYHNPGYQIIFLALALADHAIFENWSGNTKF